MRLRIRIKPRGAKARTLTWRVPARHLLLARRDRSAPCLLDISPDFIAEFEARHSAEVLEVRRPARRVRG